MTGMASIAGELQRRNDKIDKLKRQLAVARDVLKWMQAGTSGMFNDSDDIKKLIFDKAGAALEQIGAGDNG